MLKKKEASNDFRSLQANNDRKGTIKKKKKNQHVKKYISQKAMQKRNKLYNKLNNAKLKMAAL